MRTKALILSAAVSAVGIATSMAQVFSVNGVGYYTLDLAQGFSAIANQLNNGDNNINTIIPDAPIGSGIATWNNTAQAFNPDQLFFGPGFGWVDGDFNTSTLTISPGEGAFINLSGPASLTFVGEIPQGEGPDALVVEIKPLFTLIAQPTPQEVGVAATGIPASIGDVIQFWNPALLGGNGDFDPARTYTYFGAPFEWVDADFVTADPTPAVGEAFFYNSSAPATVNWTRDFSINTP